MSSDPTASAQELRARAELDAAKRALASFAPGLEHDPAYAAAQARVRAATTALNCVRCRHRCDEEDES
jgi:hypothetical protein